MSPAVANPHRINTSRVFQRAVAHPARCPAAAFTAAAAKSAMTIFRMQRIARVAAVARADPDR
jgi:hypothetical protein